MAKPASIIGGVFLATSIFLTVVINAQLVRTWLWLILVPIVGFAAGISLGAATNARYSSGNPSDYLTYTGLFGSGVILIAIYFWIFEKDAITAKLATDAISFNGVMWLNLLNGILAFLGTTLVTLPDRQL